GDGADERTALTLSIPALRLPEGATMHRLTVLYGHPRDPVAFDGYYNEVHIPIAKKMKGLKGWTVGKCESATPCERPPYYMIVGMYAATRASYGRRNIIDSSVNSLKSCRRVAASIRKAGHYLSMVTLATIFPCDNDSPDMA